MNDDFVLLLTQYSNGDDVLVRWNMLAKVIESNGGSFICFPGEGDFDGLRVRQTPDAIGQALAAAGIPVITPSSAEPKTETTGVSPALRFMQTGTRNAPASPILVNWQRVLWAGFPQRAEDAGAALYFQQNTPPTLVQTPLQVIARTLGQVGSRIVPVTVRPA